MRFRLSLVGNAIAVSLPEGGLKEHMAARGNWTDTQSRATILCTARALAGVLTFTINKSTETETFLTL